MMSSICLAITRVSFGVSARTGWPSNPRLSTPAANSSFVSLITAFSLLAAAIDAASQRRCRCDPFGHNRTCRCWRKYCRKTSAKQSSVGPSPLDESVARLSRLKEGFEVVDGPHSHGRAGVRGSAAEMRQQKNIVDLKETRIDAGLVAKHIETRSGKLARFQRVDEIVIVDDIAAGGVHDDGAIGQ